MTTDLKTKKTAARLWVRMDQNGNVEQSLYCYRCHRRHQLQIYYNRGVNSVSTVVFKCPKEDFGWNIQIRPTFKLEGASK